MKKTPKEYKELEIPEEYEFTSSGEGPLKLLTNFEALNQKGEYVAIQEIESGKHRIHFRGTLLPPPGKQLPEIQVILSDASSYEFDYSRGLKGIWIQTSPGKDGSTHYYRLMEPHPAYAPIYQELKIAAKIWIFLNSFLMEEKNKKLTIQEFTEFCVFKGVCTEDEFKNSKFMVKNWIRSFGEQNKYYAKKLVSGFNYHYTEVDGCHICESVQPLEYVACDNYASCGNQICFGCAVKLDEDWRQLISMGYFCELCRK